MEPTVIEAIAEKFGGQARLAAVLGLSKNTISTWKARRQPIPSRHVVTLLAEAKRRGIDLAPDEFFGRRQSRKRRAA